MTSVAENEISEETVKAFEHDGYAVFRSVLDQHLINEVNGHVEWLQARHPQAVDLVLAPGVNSYQPRPRYVEGRDFPFVGSSRWA